MLIYQQFGYESTTHLSHAMQVKGKCEQKLGVDWALCVYEPSDDL